MTSIIAIIQASDIGIFCAIFCVNISINRRIPARANSRKIVSIGMINNFKISYSFLRVCARLDRGIVLGNLELF